jgi:predicted TIM-barrel fold metal-dependent hydrolase
MTTTSQRQYRLISADGHLMEPRDLWVSRAPAKYREQVPRIESFPEGDAWVVPGQKPVSGFNWGACAGRRPDELGRWCRLADINPGAYDAKARVEELDLDGVDAEVLFPNTSLEWASEAKDPEFHRAMVRIYNDFLCEFCDVAPERFGGCALLPSTGIEDAVAEIERLAARPGIVAWLLRTFPHGGSDAIAPEDDKAWAAIHETGKPVTIHVSLRSATPFKLVATALPGTFHFYDAPPRMLDFIFSGVLDRFPNLIVFFAEIDCGWLPYFAQQADDNYLRHSRSDLRDVKLGRMPSEYMKERMPASFITDAYAVDNRHAVGVERMLWSSDYPHITSDWPYSWKTINATFADVPDDERHAILAGNAQQIFGFGSRIAS